jgi:hypothetical protein
MKVKGYIRMGLIGNGIYLAGYRRSNESLLVAIPKLQGRG